MSSSSISTSSSSSSVSEEYCVYPDCDGYGCGIFTDWYLAGITPQMTENGNLYAKFERTAETQYVRIYRDSARLYLIAVGMRRFGAGSIELTPMDGSGVYGSVTWNGVYTDSFGETRLSCVEMSSSSSEYCVSPECYNGLSCNKFSNWNLNNLSESFIPSGVIYVLFNVFGSSQQVELYKDYQLGYCAYPICDGYACDNFTNWYLTGVNKNSLEDETLYVNFEWVEILGIYRQRVRLYTDAALLNLVAAGTTDVAGNMYLISKNGSGIQGSLSWGGTPVNSFSEQTTLSCFENNPSGYFNLISIGISDVAGTMQLFERNGSGVNGTVEWNGILTGASETAILSCKELSSSSSSSSIDSSSSSSSNTSGAFSTSSLSSPSSYSSSSLSSSSSSSLCCENPYCDGQFCENFSGWHFDGMLENNTRDCQLYIGFDSMFSSIQQVRVYSDPNLNTLVAIGQNTTGTIVLNEIGDSGLSGSVEWNGVVVNYPSYVTLSCYPFSSSSSNSSSSSSSSSSYGVSTSSSSTSNSSSSSISEISSSESSGNTSSSSSSNSSSSSFEIWNLGKPLVMAHAAIDGGSINNRLAQTLKLNEDSYYISKVYCYLMGIYGESDNFIVNLGIYLCDDEGEPSSLVQLATIDADTIKSDGWYPFVFDIDIVTPLNQYLSFVMWQDGGDEDNYIMWAYGLNLNGNELVASILALSTGINSGLALPSSTKTDTKCLPSGLRDTVTVLIAPSKSR